MKEYVKNLTFKLKDFEGTKERYKDYKTKEFAQLMKDSKESVKIHFKHLQEDIENEFYIGRNMYYFDSLDLSAKMDVRFLKTNINHVCQGLNTGFMTSIVRRPNKNKIRCFAVLFYLKYYSKINSIMHNTLEDMMKRWWEDGNE